MSTVLGFSFAANCSYQHIQGVMLFNLNQLACKLKLSHSEFRIMALIIGLWNKNEGKAFPTIEYLSRQANMGKSTTIKILNHLNELNLILVVKTPGKRNNYYLSNLLLKPRGIEIDTTASPACETTHDKHMKTRTYQNKTILSKNNPNKIAKQPSVNSNLDSIDINKAKYKHIRESNYTENKNILRLKEMTKHKYWQHTPSKKIFKVLPEVGNHILIHYNPEKNLITLTEEDFMDILDNFKTVDNIEKISDKPENHNISRIDIILKLIKENKLEEAKYLAKLFKLKAAQIIDIGL